MIEYLTPISSTLIGWLTNKMAIKMLFSPKKKILGIQGLLIKRKKDLAESISDIIVNRLLDSDEFQFSQKNLDKMVNVISDHLVKTMGDGIFESELSKEVVKDIIKNKVRHLIFSSAGSLVNSPDALKQTIATNIMLIPDKEIEEIVTKIAKKEFRAIELIGAIIGFVIGVANLILVGV